MGAHSAKATRTAVAAGKSVVKNETLKEILATSPQNAVITEAPSAATAALSAEELHKRDDSLVLSVNQLSEAVELKELPGTNWSAKNYQLFKEMQRNPRMPQTPKQYETQLLPNSSVLRGAQPALPPPVDADPPSSLEEATSALALQNPRRVTDETGVTVFGRRPSEGSGNDQLVLAKNLLDNLLDPAEVVELMRRHSSDPVKFSPAALAERFDVEEELVLYLLKYTSVPTVVQVDSELYGVYEIRDIDDMGKS